MNYTRNKPINCLKWSISIALCIMVICVTACRRLPASKNPVLAALLAFPNFRPTADTKAVVIIADNSCMTCNKELAALMSSYLSRPDMLFVIAAHESAIDLSPFTNARRKDIVFDYNHALTDNQVVKGSTVLFLRHGDVDTSIQIEASALEQQLAYLKQQL